MKFFCIVFLATLSWGCSKAQKAENLKTAEEASPNLEPASPGSSSQSSSLAVQLDQGAMKLTLKSGQGPLAFDFKKSEEAKGFITHRTGPAEISVKLPVGTTLGQRDSEASYIYVYALDTEGTMELAVSSHQFEDGQILSTRTFSAGADRADAVYSEKSHQKVSSCLVGRLLSLQATAGIYNQFPQEITLAPLPPAYPVEVFMARIPGSLIPVAESETPWIYDGRYNSPGNYTFKLRGFDSVPSCHISLERDVPYRQYTMAPQILSVTEDEIHFAWALVNELNIGAGEHLIESDDALVFHIICAAPQKLGKPLR